jgi:serine/threonine protein kinase
MAIAFQKEREILSSLSIWKHAHILGFISSFEVPSEPKFGHYNLILPYAEGGDLHQFLRLPSPPEWLFTGPGCIPFCKTLYIQTKGIVDGLGFLHAKTSSAGYVIHRDIKPANILIHNATFKIADFGSSRIKASEETSKTEWAVGTLMYAPPEKTLEDSDMYGRARDVWALGCVMLEILVLLLYGFREPAAVEVFERERLESTKKDVKAFSRTMECVEVWMANIDGLLQTGHVREKDRWVDEDWDNEQKMLRTLLGAIRSMLKVNRLERVESSRVLEYLTVS